MREIIKRYFLPFDATLPFFMDQIISEQSFGRGVEKYIDFSKGSFFTFLPEGVSKDQLLNFKCGEITPSIPMTLDGSVRKVVTRKYECSEFIADFLQRNSQSKLILEDYNSAASSPREIPNVPVCTLDEEVYYVLSNNNSIEEIYISTRRCSIVWHLLAIVSTIDDSSLALEKASIKKVCENAQLVITCAYDNESYIFWERGTER